MMKRILFVVLCMMLLVSCSAEPVSLLDFIGGEDSVSYDGLKLVFYSKEGLNGPLLFAYEDNNSPQSDAMKNRLADIENRLDLDISFTSEGEHDFANYYITTMGSGICPADLLYEGPGNPLWDLAVINMLLPMTDFPDHIDLSDSDKYGTPGILEACMINGIPYAVQPTYWIGYQGLQCFVTAYNADWFSTLNLTPLHEYYENETWTWDTFLSVCDTAAPIISSEDGERVFSACDEFLLGSSFYSNGYDYMDVVDGKAVLNLYDEAAIHAIEFYQKILGYGDKVEFRDSYEDTDSFVEGRVLMKLATTQSVVTGDIAYKSRFTYNIMPFPCGPDSEYGRWAQSVSRIYGLAIPVSTEEPDVVAHVVSELCEPFEEFGGGKEGLYEYYKNEVFLSETDAEIFFELGKYVRYDYNDSSVGFYYLEDMSKNADSASATELIQKYGYNLEKVFEEYMEPNLTGYIIEKMNLE